RLRAWQRVAQDFGGGLPLTRSAGWLTPAGASTQDPSTPRRWARRSEFRQQAPAHPLSGIAHARWRLNPRSFDSAPMGAPLRISAAGSRSPAQRDRSRPLAPQHQILRLRADGRSAQDFGSGLPLARSAGSLTPAGASTLQHFGFLFHNPARLLRCYSATP